MKPKIRLLLLLISLLATVVSGYRMWQLNEEEILWGHLPLFLFLFAFAFFVLLFGKRLFADRQRQRWLALSLLSALLLSLAFPPIPLTFLLFIGFVPLLIVEEEVSLKKSSRLLFGYMYCSFILWNILTTFWVANTAFLAGIFAISANALLMSIPFFLFHKSKKLLSANLAAAAFITFWITFEYLHMRWELSWPWLTLGNAFSEFPSWIQWYEFSGVFGGSLWALLANILFFNAYKLRNEGSKLVAFSRPVLFVILPIVASVVIYLTHEEKGEPKEIVVVQPNYEPHYQKFEIPLHQQLDHYIALSKSKLSPQTDYLVFPETSFGQIDQNKLEINSVIRDLQKFVDGYPKLHLVTGISSQKTYAPGEPLSPSARTHIRSNGDTLYWESYNAAIQISSGEKEVPYYFKSILVPGAENFPFRKYLFFLQPIVDALGGATALGTQEKRSVFWAGDVAVAPVICYESIFGEYETGYIRKGANALFIVTNDGWWSNTAGHRQHLAYASLRAIESRRSIARSANTGVSAFINQRGDILQPTRYDEATAISGTIQLNDEITFYVRWGDLIGRVSMFATIMLLLNAFAKGWLKQAQRPKKKV